VAGLFGDSFKCYTAANKLFSELNDTFGVAYSHCGIGNALRMKADYSGALLHFRKATALYRKIGDIVSFSYTLWSLGKTYAMIGRLDKAMDYFRQSSGFFRKTKDPRGIIYCKLGMGEIEFLRGRLSPALANLNAALRDSLSNGFSVEKCHAAALLSFVNKKNGKNGNRCYNKLGLKLKFQSIPFNIP